MNVMKKIYSLFIGMFLCGLIYSQTYETNFVDGTIAIKLKSVFDENLRSISEQTDKNIFSKNESLSEYPVLETSLKNVAVVTRLERPAYFVEDKPELRKMLRLHFSNFKDIDRIIALLNTLDIVEYAENIDQARDWAQRIAKNIGMVLNVIEEMRVTVTPPNPIEVDVRERINEVLTDTKIPQGIKVSNDFEKNIDSTIIGYHRQIGQVFRVVIYNALDSMEGEGALIISSKKLITHNKQYIQINISDTGKGIPNELQRNVFELGGEKKSKRGFGMGLAWCRLFLQMTGGDIKMNSKIGFGTTVTILIPKSIISNNLLQNQS